MKNLPENSSLFYKIISNYYRFINSCRSNNSFRLTPLSDISPYALCFAIFGYHLVGKCDILENNKECWNYLLRHNLNLKRAERLLHSDLRTDKPYLQLLCFTLSSLYILRTLDDDPLHDIILELIPSNLNNALHSCGAFNGQPRSGNQAMFIAILLIYAKQYINVDTSESIDLWVNLHLKKMNQFGFWGYSKSMSHLQFQNGYHQYEIFEYLNTSNVPWDNAAKNVSLLSDIHGHYAPYPGGGGCYDYDAIFMQTCASRNFILDHKNLLLLTLNTIVKEQGHDGGFSESIYVRPRSPKNIFRCFRHIYLASGNAQLERLKYSLTLLRSKHNHIHTHWSKYSRRWNESNLWDSWFRMLTIARIDISLHPENHKKWGFINFPGIGYHSSFKNN